MILLLNLEFLLGSVFSSSSEILSSVSSSFSLKGFLEHLLFKVLAFSQHVFLFFQGQINSAEEITILRLNRRKSCKIWKSLRRAPMVVKTVNLKCRVHQVRSK